jgi:hypothetical protein
MERCQWFVTAATAMSLIAIREAAAQEPARLAVRVAIHDSATVPIDVLETARNRAVAAFEKAGVDVEWAVPGSGTSPCSSHDYASFCIQVLLRPRNPQSAPGSRRIMGMALAADERRAVLSLYFDAVTDVARRYGSPRGEVLGLALVHEMGHVLLPPPSHSATGIMQPSWEGDDIRHVLAGDVTFTEAQVLAMRARLAVRR